LSEIGVFRIDGVAKGAVEQAERGAVDDVQYQIAKNGQETRTQAESEKTGAHQWQENDE
jgi:hypothetical protein